MILRNVLSQFFIVKSVDTAKNSLKNKSIVAKFENDSLNKFRLHKACLKILDTFMVGDR